LLGTSWLIFQNQLAATAGDGSIAGLLEQRGNLVLRGEQKDMAVEDGMGANVTRAA
jgi:hypothetical protein